ncbi:uncharacterized protein LOC110862398 [Folsomia candida]|nr:uncharacterized protein LOC110862398 [Folsomia candida]
MINLSSSILLVACLAIGATNAWFCRGTTLYCYPLEIMARTCPSVNPCAPAPTTVRATAPPPTTTRSTTAPPATTTTVATTLATTMATMNGTCPLLECCHFNCWIGAVCTKSTSPTAAPTCSDGGVPTMCANYVNPFSTYCLSLGCAPMSCQQTTCNAGNGNRLCTPYS